MTSVCRDRAVRQTSDVVDTFVGRERELAALAGVRRRAVEGRRQLVVVTGEAGIGKTWFCEHASESAEREGLDVVWGRCWSHGGAPPLWPWPAVLAALAGPAGARLLAADDDRDDVGPERFARFAATAELLTATRADAPTMIVIDDAHQADQSALLLTRFLAGVLDRLPLVLVLARRPRSSSGAAPADALLDELAQGATSLALHPFDLHDTAELLAAHGQPRAEDDDTSALLKVTGGSPLYLARAVSLDWGATGPATVEHAVADAIARRPPRERRILSYAAMLGGRGTTAEIATLADEPPAAVLAVLTAASGAGLVDPAPDGWVFHDLVRQAALAELDANELLDAHAGAAALLEGIGHHPERVAGHALAAAARSRADTEAAIARCRAAASSLRRGYAYEPAADLLGKAVALAEHHPDAPGYVELLVDRADAVLACGRLTEARAAFEVATEAAERAGHPVLFARAVLGLGGVWVHEHRNAVVRHHVLARQRAALDALPECERALRCRLTVRLAAEAVYEGEPVEAVLDALAQARELDDDRVLAEALSLTHHALLAPEHTTARLSLAKDQITAASAAGDGILALFGLLWRTADLYLLGDPDADRSLTELRQRSDALGVATTGYIVACMDVMRLIRAGRLDEAEAAAEPCLRLGLEVGDADATGYYGAQLLAIRWAQGRDAELADLVADTVASATLAVVEYGFRASVVMVLARGGRLTEARAALAPLREGKLAALPRSSTWLAAMAGLAEAARLLQDPGLAEEVAELLAPFADLPVMPSLAVSCFGSAARALGLAALTIGDPDAAVAHLEHAVRDNQRLRHRPATAMSEAELATALVVRGGPGDLARARTRLAAAASAAKDMGMRSRAESWSAQAAALEVPTEPPVLRRHGTQGWTLHSGGGRIDLPDMVGLHHLSRLLEQPDCDIAAADLGGSLAASDRQELLDDAAIHAYRQRVRELDAAIGDAEADADLARTERLRQERDTLAAELSRSLGLGGRARGFASTPERARTAVRKAIKRAIDVIAAADPVLGDELRAGVSTGTVCRYTPAARRWQVDRG